MKSIIEICHQCTKKLIAHPVIYLDGTSFCFTCAKNLDEIRREEVKKQTYLLNSYDLYCRNIEQKHWSWEYSRREYAKPVDHPFWGFFIIIAIGIYAIVHYKSFLTMIILVVSLIYYFNEREEEYRIRFKNYAEDNPEPKIKYAPPKATIQPYRIDSKSLRYKNSTVQFNRDVILERDNYTCQKCWRVFHRSLLEVHHINPISKGGDHCLINLITLCINCHNDEDWFGHIRAFKRDMDEE